MLQLRRNRHLWLPRVMDMTQSPEVLILLLPNHVQEMRQKRLCILYWGFLQSCPESAHSVTGRQKNSRSRETTLKRQGRCAILI